MQQKSLFITFEGCDGSGKSTQSKLLFEWLQSQNLKVILTREPGGTDSAEAIREILLNKHMKFEAISQLLLINVARNEHVCDVILPHLAQDYIVICDRYADSTRAYQGYGSDVDLELINNLHAMVINNLEPEVTFVLDVPIETSLRRMAKKKHVNDRFETQQREFYENVAAGFRSIAWQYRERCMLIDASSPIEQTEILIRERVQALLCIS